MPLVLHHEMTDHEILVAIARTYASPSNWESYEKDMGHGHFDVAPWIKRDNGEYARRGLEMIRKRYEVSL